MNEETVYGYDVDQESQASFVQPNSEGDMNNGDSGEFVEYKNDNYNQSGPRTTIKWNANETKFLLEKYMELVCETDDGQFGKKKFMWTKLASLINEKFNYNLTPLQVTTRFKTVMKRKKKGIVEFDISGHLPNKKLKNGNLNSERENHPVDLWNERQTEFLMNRYSDYIEDYGKFQNVLMKKKMWKELTELLNTEFNSNFTMAEVIGRYQTISKSMKKTVVNRENINTPTHTPYDALIKEIETDEESSDPETIMRPKKDLIQSRFSSQTKQTSPSNSPNPFFIDVKAGASSKRSRSDYAAQSTYDRFLALYSESIKARTKFWRQRDDEKRERAVEKEERAEKRRQRDREKRIRQHKKDRLKLGIWQEKKKLLAEISSQINEVLMEVRKS